MQVKHWQREACYKPEGSESLHWCGFSEKQLRDKDLSASGLLGAEGKMSRDVEIWDRQDRQLTKGELSVSNHGRQLKLNPIGIFAGARGLQNHTPRSPTKGDYINKWQAMLSTESHGEREREFKSDYLQVIFHTKQNSYLSALSQIFPECTQVTCWTKMTDTPGKGKRAAPKS